MDTNGNTKELIKDLCSRLPYGVKVDIPDLFVSTKNNIEVLDEIFCGDDGEFRCNDSGILIKHVKPYLFPLSSITEEQSIDLFKLFGISLVDSIGADYIKINECTGIIFFLDKGFDIETHLDKLIDWLNKHHFDYRCLIEKGLAIDATGLNIY